MSKLVQMPVPIFLDREGKWFVAGCPALDLATQGRTEKEAKANMADLIQAYLNDPDTNKDFLKHQHAPSLTYVPVSVPLSALA